MCPSTYYKDTHFSIKKTFSHTNPVKHVFSLKCMYTVGNEQGRKELGEIKGTLEAHAQRSFQSHFKIKCLKSGFNLQFKI